MDHEEGVVVSVNDATVIIKMESCEECRACSARHACVAIVDEAARTIEVPITREIEKLHEGDKVGVLFRPGPRILSAFIVFIVPLIFLIAGYFIGFRLYSNEGKAILMSLIALVISFVVVWVTNKFLVKSRKFIPEIFRI